MIRKKNHTVEKKIKDEAVRVSNHWSGMGNRLRRDDDDGPGDQLEMLTEDRQAMRYTIYSCIYLSENNQKRTKPGTIPVIYHSEGPNGCVRSFQ